MPLEYTDRRHKNYRHIYLVRCIFYKTRERRNMSTRKFLLLTIAVLTVVSMAQYVMPTKAQGPVTVTLFIGLGTGTNKDQVDAENAFVDAYNKGQGVKDGVTLKVNIAASNQEAPGILSTLIGSVNPPDIVGPVGVSGSNLFYSEWLDLAPLIKKTGFNMSAYSPAVTSLYKQGNTISAIPWAVYPGLMWYNVDLFDEAGLNPPPKNFGEKYVLDGKQVDWTWDTVATIAKRLTFDANGKDATDPAFDPKNIIQYGFDQQFDTIRSDFETFGGGNPNGVVDKNNKVVIAPEWRAEAKWMWNGLWKDHFIPNNTAINSDLLKPSVFASGKVAMTRVMLWYTCCLADSKTGKAYVNFDLAPVPMYNGKYFAPADADTFRIDKNTKNPEAAFKVLTYILNDADVFAPNFWGGFPGRTEFQAGFIKKLADTYKSVKNWAIVSKSFDYAVSPHHESYYPNFNKGQNRFADFSTLLRSDQGATIDIDKELDKLQSDLQTLVDQAGQPAAATMAATAAK